MNDGRLKDFPRMGQCFIYGALANGADLNEVLLSIQKNDPQRFMLQTSPG